MFDYRSSILVNHVGFPRAAPKICVVPEAPRKEFVVSRLQDTEFRPVHGGTLSRGGGEIADGWVGDFSPLTEEGIYRISCGDLVSRCFVVWDNVYYNPLRVVFTYFPWQRCGDSTSGWNAPCHAKEGIRLETGAFRDLSGGFHQSGDLRKWTWGLALGLTGLLQFALSESPRWDTGAIAEEIRWGCDYFHAMARDDGALMDGTFLPEGWGEGDLAGRTGFQDYGLPWKSREFYRSESPAPSQWNNVRLQTMAAVYFRDKDPAYSGRCLAAARATWTHMTSPSRSYALYAAPKLPPLGHKGMNVPFPGFYRDSALELAHRLCAAMSLFRATGEAEWREEAASTANHLVALQFGGDVGANPACACLRESRDSPVLANSYFYFWHTSGPLGLMELLEAAPDHPDAASWKECVHRIAEQHRVVAGRNPYRRVPATWYRAGSDPFDSPAFFSFSTNVEKSRDECFGGTLPPAGKGSGERDCLYKFYSFCYNIDIMGAGIFMRRAARLFGEDSYRGVAQGQLDWILGANPFDSSTVEGVGYNQPHRGLFGEFFPCTPQIPGAISTGVTPNSSNPNGFGLDNEYDMPMVGWMLWLMSDLARS